ncbi:glutamate receptor 4-like isoform X2 [Fopius arisanus]|nr:PREDICTED: glutamate receptor 4-like isoform X2 [Fopius arisanus]XP_011300262.1 PREDICTED: glutamate receptor 4-like isoform X2 [Fopius arisanus]
MNLMTFENNGTKLSGLLGDMWTMLADFLNFTIEAVEIPEAKFGSQSSESHIGLIGMLRRNEVDIVPRVAFYLNTNDIIDYSTPLWTNSFRVYVRPQFESDDSWIFKTFPLPCWISIIISIGLFSLLGALFDRLNQAMIRFHGNTLQNLLLEHFFYTLGAFCNQGSIAVHVERSRIMAFSRRASAWLIISIFSTTLVASMTHKEMHLPFTGIDSLLVKTDYKLILSTASLAFSKFQDIILPNYTSRKYRRKIKYVSVAEDMYRTGCHGTGKDALFEAEDRHRARATRTCTFIPTEEAYFSTWITTGMVKGFQFKRPIDNGILKLIEVGLLDALKDRWLIPPLSWPPDKYVVVGMKQVYVIFTVLAIGVIVSLIIFIVEYIVFIHRRHHLRRKWDKQLRKQALRLKIPLHNQNLLVNESSPKERNIFLL